ncbi:cupin [Fusibacter sp. 3D3]|uniref:cupin n=1 Tax=Fusibacter sp. 3D3 TaxID=1048380 RepID=UPI000852D173|nr:cupin [Fusibacter sp. 3D3]GAU76901.1 cupin 2 [Fusibacter sp. 3D3]
MENQNLFQTFSKGHLVLPNSKVEFDKLQWHAHKQFQGVSLKHIITSEQTDGLFSYHLVKIEPFMKIGMHVHESQLETHEIISGTGICLNQTTEMSYAPGVISIFNKGEQHEVIADADGLYLFAKFMPALV